jgi:hypothetical protein
MARAPGAVEAFLAPLGRQVRRHRGIEALVFWGSAAGWDDTPAEVLEAEEIAFYAEGLLEDGFRMAWALVALADSPGAPDHLRLWFWQDDSPPPPLPPGWHSIARATWPPD